MNTVEEHKCEFEWKERSTSSYLLGYYVCRICGFVKFKQKEDALDILKTKVGK